MTTEDKEVIEAFTQEVAQIRERLKPVVAEMCASYQDGKVFTKFGQLIDGIYGTAATLGYKELADYCYALKSINNLGNQTTNMYARGQIKELDVMAMKLIESFGNVIMKPDEIRKLQYALKKEQEKAADLAKRFFEG